MISPHDPIRWLLRDKGLVDEDPVWWMLRLLDAPAAIGGRGFPAGVAVDVPVELTDAQLAGNAGRFRLAVADGAGALEPDRPPRPPLRARAERPRRALRRDADEHAAPRRPRRLGGRPDDDAALDAAFAARPFMLDYF